MVCYCEYNEVLLENQSGKWEYFVVQWPFVERFVRFIHTISNFGERKGK